MTQVAEKIREVAELKEDFEVLKDVKGVDLSAKEFQVHDTCKRKYIRNCPQKEVSDKKDAGITDTDKEFDDFEAEKECMNEKVLFFNQPVRWPTFILLCKVKDTGDTRYRNRLKARIIEEFPDQLYFLTVDCKTPQILVSQKGIAETTIFQDKEILIKQTASLLRNDIKDYMNLWRIRLGHQPLSL